MTKPANIADLKTQKATEVDLFSGDIEDARREKTVLLNLIDDQSARALPGVDSFVLFDLEDAQAEDTKTNGTAQSDLSGGALPTTLAINEFKTVPGYFKYVLGEHSRINWVTAFIQQAPKVAVLEVEKAAIAALRGIGANSGHYVQLGGANANGAPNSVPTVANYETALNKLVQEMKLDATEIMSIGSEIGKYSLPTIFGLYDRDASSALGDLAKSKGFVREILGIPHFASLLIWPKEHIIFHKRAVAYAIRTKAQLDFQGLASQAQDYYGVRISYGVIARQDNRAVVMQDGAAFSSTYNKGPEASNVHIQGTLKSGETLTGSYVYSDAESNAEGTSTFKWYRSDNVAGLNKAAISGATSQTYELAVGDVGKFISFEVTPVAGAGTLVGTPVESAKYGAVASAT